MLKPASRVGVGQRFDNLRVRASRCTGALAEAFSQFLGAAALEMKWFLCQFRWSRDRAMACSLTPLLLLALMILLAQQVAYIMALYITRKWNSPGDRPDTVWKSADMQPNANTNTPPPMASCNQQDRPLRQVPARHCGGAQSASKKCHASPHRCAAAAQRAHQIPAGHSPAHQRFAAHRLWQSIASHAAFLRQGLPALTGTRAKVLIKHTRTKPQEHSTLPGTLALHPQKPPAGGKFSTALPTTGSRAIRPALVP